MAGFDDRLGVDRLRALRFAGLRCCPHCGCRRTQGWGEARGRRRYRCTGCRRTFNEWTGTAFANLHFPEKWSRFALCLLAGLTVREAARRIGIHPSTAFRWRHRLLAALDRVAPSPLTSIVEIHERYFLHSEKGQRRLHRPARRRGRGWSIIRPREGICALVLKDRFGGVHFAVTGFGRPTPSQLEQQVVPLVRRGSILLPDRHGAAYPMVSRRNGLLCLLPSQRRLRALPRDAQMRIGVAFELRQRLDAWLARFRGVATKYLPYYLRWYAFLEQAPGVTGGNGQDRLLAAVLAGR